MLNPQCPRTLFHILKSYSEQKILKLNTLSTEHDNLNIEKEEKYTYQGLL